MREISLITINYSILSFYSYIYVVIQQKAVESDIWKNKLSILLEKLEITPENISLYILAFIHRSIVNERPDFAPEHNERLEFLWDAVLELVITDNLYKDYPSKPEWELTDIRSALVRGTNLSKVARNLWFPEYLLLWKWEEKSGWRDNDYLLANVVESFLWALYLDKGLWDARAFIDLYVYTTLENILENNLTKDFKTIIQELAQADFDITPTYKVLSESGPDHNKNFDVWIYLKEKQIGQWSGSSKKKAQEAAAKDWYRSLTSKK